jgi:DNA polymerase-3 subunit delta'
VIGQERAVATLQSAVRRPVHAYLLVGPPGTGKQAAAVSFAASILCPDPRHMSDCDSCRRVFGGFHPDVIEIEREGAFIDIDTAREVTRMASMSPVEGERKVVILHDFHLVRDTGPALLKTIEEPPPSTIFVILAEYLPPELVTIASRCVRIDFDPLPPAAVSAALVADGVDPLRAADLAEASGGRLDRARLLAGDDQFAARRRAWREIPSRLDGSGATAAAVADELVGYLDTKSGGRAGGKVGARSSKAALNSGVKELEERHRRAERRQRTDELRSGLSALAGAYRERMGAGADPRRRAAAIAAITEIDKLSKSLAYNPGELLALQALLARLGRLATR